MCQKEISGCCCSIGKPEFFSRKKRIEALKNDLAALEDRAEDLREYISELEKING
jgi:hypothetical protein